MEWSNLNPRPQFDIQLRFIVILIHNILTIPICIKKYQHEVNENSAIKTDPEQATMSKSLESFLSNCFIMGLLFISIFVLNAYGR